jgi:hypothetical protein
MQSGEREIPPSLSFGSSVCVCVQELQQSRIFWTLLCTHEMQAIYLLAPFTISITCNTLLPAETTIILCGRVLMIFLLSYFEHCQIWLKVFLQTITTWAKTQNWGTKKTLLWVWTSVVVRFWCFMINLNKFIKRWKCCHKTNTTWWNQMVSLEEKNQYVTNAFTITCDYLVFSSKVLPFATNVKSC